jgi:hypothetical protein
MIHDDDDDDDDRQTDIMMMRMMVIMILCHWCSWRWSSQRPRANDGPVICWLYQQSCRLVGYGPSRYIAYDHNPSYGLWILVLPKLPPIPSMVIHHFQAWFLTTCI